jgi:hypothetical protein
MNFLIVMTLSIFMIFGAGPFALMTYATLRDRKIRLAAESRREQDEPPKN